jgi:hypothetical protein
MKPVIKIDFIDFWQGLDKLNNFFVKLLVDKFDVEISDNPDVIFYSVFGTSHTSYSCKKIFYTGENRRPSFDECDYALTFDYNDDPRHYRLPLYVLYKEYPSISSPKEINTKSALNRKFCNFLVSNPSCQQRNEFFSKLSIYKQVDSGGVHMNNMGYTVTDKLEFQKQYKFSIAFENSSSSGYVTEKIFDPMLALSIPIYWGAPDVDKDFNRKSFVNIHDFSSIDDAIEYIKYLDQNDDAYIQKLNEDWLLNNEIPCKNKLENVKEFILSSIYLPVNTLTT